MSNTSRAGPTVQPPPAPGDPEAWYAPDVRAQYAVHPGVVATVTAVDGDESFRYETREPTLGPSGAAEFGAISDRFDAGQHRRPHSETTDVRHS